MKTLRWILGALLLCGLALAIVLVRPGTWLLGADPVHAGFSARVVDILLVAAAMVLFRVLRGPTAADRIVAIDIFGILVVGLCAVLCVVSGRSWYIDIGIAWALQSFISTLALAKHLEGRALDD